MKTDEFAFLNLQLAGMLKDGLPLEGSLRRLCATLRKGAMRDEYQRLEADLAAGVPLAEAAARRAFPELYIRMLGVAARSNDLPGVLTMLADYYQKSNLILMRCRGLLAYPVLLLILASALSLWFGSLSRIVARSFAGNGINFNWNQFYWTQWTHAVLPPALAITATGLFLAAMCVPKLRQRFFWKVPPFREARMAQFAEAMHLMLRQGCTLDEALALAAGLESGSPAEKEIQNWREQLASGCARWSAISRAGGLFGPLFHWLVASSGEDLAAGFQRAARLYKERAEHVREIFLYAALPVALLTIGLILLSQIYPFITLVFKMPTLLYVF